DAERMRAALDASLRATDLADLLVEAGVPFRESHALVGKLVREAERAGVPLDRVPQAVARGIHPALGAARAQLGGWEDSVGGRATPGGASRKSGEQQQAERRKACGAGAGTEPAPLRRVRRVWSLRGRPAGFTARRPLFRLEKTLCAALR